LDDFRSLDVPTLVSADHDPEHRRRFEIPDSFVPTIQHAERTLVTWLRKKAMGTSWTLAVRDCVTGDLLGGCELSTAGADAARLSYWIYPPHRSRGAGTRAVSLASQWALDQLGFARIELSIDSDNHPSRLIALRNGFTERGLHEGRVQYVKERS